jgi:hypothetical protein
MELLIHNCFKLGEIFFIFIDLIKYDFILKYIFPLCKHFLIINFTINKQLIFPLC